MDAFRVLYVDDEPGLLEIGKLFLEQSGQFTVDTIASAPAALALLSEIKYDAIISDYHMPKMDGIDFLKEVRSSENTVPFILFTGRGREEIVIQALNEGADFYLQKGGDPQSQFVELSHKIRRAISQKKAETALVTRESYLTAIIENQPGLVWLKDTEGRFLATNEAFARSCGKKNSADVLGKTDMDIWPRELAEKYRADDVRVIEEKKPVQVEEKIFDLQELKWFETSKSPIIDARGRVIGTTGFARDITGRKQADAALRESEEKFREIFDTINDGIHIHEIAPDGMPGKFIEVNEVACRMLQCTREELLDHGPLDFTTGYHSRPLEEIVSEYSSTGHAIFETEHRRKDGTLVPVEIHTHLVILQGKRAIVSVVRDITERRKGEKALREREDDLRQKNLKLTTLNDLEREFAELPSGRKVEELAVKKLSELTGAVVTVFSTYDPVEQILRTTAIEFGPGILESLPGAWEKVSSWIGMKPDEVEVPVSEEMYQDINRSIIGRKNTITEISYGWIPPLVSASIQKLSGVNRFIHIAHIIDGHLYGTSVIGLRPDRSDPSEELLDSFGHMIAVSLRRQRAELALRESEDRYRTLVENANEAILVIQDGRICFANPKLEEIGKYSAQELAQKPFLEFVHPEDRAMVGEQHKRRLAGDVLNQYYTFRIVSKAGSAVWNEIRSSLITWNGRPAVLVVLQDITDRKSAESALQESEERFRSFIEQALEGVSIVDEEGRIIEWNTAQEHITGIARADALGVLAWDLATRMIPDEHRREDIRSRMRESILLTIESGKSTYTQPVYYRFLRPDGSVAVARQTVFAIKTTHGHMIGTLNQDVTEQQHAEKMITESEEKFRSLVEYALESISIIDFSGKGLFTNRATARLLELDDDTPLAGRSVMEFLSSESQKDAVKDFTRVAGGEDGYLSLYTVTTAKGNTIYVECIGKVISYEGKSAILLSLRDITGRKRIEEALRSANRQLTLLTGVTRHDILNKISVILGFLKIARMKITDPAISDYLKKIDENTAAIKSQIEFTRVYQDLGTHEPQWLALETVIPRSQVPAAITLNADGKDIWVFADPMLEKVFSNLLDNSLRHGQRVSSIRVSLRMAKEDLVVVWEDDGIGIPADEKEQIFERGFGKNTGLGMFLAREILSITGIAITEKGEPGKGARFEIRVPKGAYRISGV
jgi:PAS domain S-box-containing protein